MKTKIFSGIFFVTLIFSSTANLHGSWNQGYKSVKYGLNKVIGKISPKWAAVCSIISGLVISNIILYRNYRVLKNELVKINNDVARELTAYARRTCELEEQMDHVKRALLNAGIVTSIR